MSGIRVDQDILNQKGTPAFNASAYIDRPAAGFVGRIFISIDTKQLFRDTGTAWDLISDAGSGSSNLSQVTLNGNYTPYGINITNGGLFLLGTTNGSIFFADGGSGQFTTDNATFFWDNTNKRLGIGTATPGVRLDVHSSSGTTATFNGTGVTNALLTFQSAGTSKWSVGNFVSSTVANDFNIYDNVNTVSRLQVHNTGVVNIPNSLIIGTTTPTSSYAFDVTGIARITSTLTLGTITAGSVLFGGTSGVISQNNSQFFWDNTNNRLGIGTATPSYVFDVNSTTNARLSLTGTTNFVVTNMNNTSGAFYSGIDDSAGANFTGIPYARFIYSGASYPFITIVNGAQASKIFPNGNTIIGTTTTDNGQKLQVNGSFKFISLGGTTISFYGDTYANGMALANRTATTGSWDHFYFQNPNGNVGAISTNGSVTTYASLSDYRLKRDLKNYCGLDLISKIKTYDFEWIIDKKRMYGVLAHELQDIIPYAVNGDKDGKKMQSVDYSKIVPALIKAIQELNEKLLKNNIN